MPLSFDTEMAAHFREGDLDCPAADEPAKDVERVGIKIGAEEGLWRELAGRVTHQDIADGNAMAWVVSMPAENSQGPELMLQRVTADLIANSLERVMHFARSRRPSPT